MTPVLDIGEFSLGFGTTQGPARVLDRVDLAVGPGEIVGLVGESGCGKTTLARAILGMLPEHQARIDGGHIRLDGIDMLQNSEAARHARGRLVTLVPQDPYASFNPLFRVGTQIADLMRWTAPTRKRRRFGGSRRIDEAAALEMLAAVQLPQPRKILARYPHQLSGGQRQRVMIAMALLPQPRIIIADEPTAALDAIVQAQILRLLRRIAAERGVAILFATHNLGAAWEICDRIAVLYAGQIVEAAPRDAFFARPRHPYTRGLLASMPEPGRDPVGIPGDVPSPLSPSLGCPFSPRCSRASNICRDARPSLGEEEPGHWVACHHPAAAPFASV
ncbi:ABC transporter ATP-binding protein [Mesorhizobium sp. IMUNJ 23232]|uniref:ABC transporter ATP-binding protein n=1 Tax=Mesorhizobium sp. IMUNJ 23232 TaxID=3376064 RepID=UPI00379ED03E